MAVRKQYTALQIDQLKDHGRHAIGNGLYLEIDSSGKQPTVWYRSTDKIYPPVGKYGLYVELVSAQTLKADDALCIYGWFSLIFLYEKPVNSSLAAGLMSFFSGEKSE